MPVISADMYGGAVTVEISRHDYIVTTSIALRSPSPDFRCISSVTRSVCATHQTRASSIFLVEPFAVPD